MILSRRELIRLFGLSFFAGYSSNSVLGNSGVDFPPAVKPRIPLEEFVQDSKLLSSLRKGVAEMKKRKPSDPLSFFYQAAIHGVTQKAIDDIKDTDPAAERIFKEGKYWNQCPHNKQHSANFLPWHRAYTYYFERILRLHTGDRSFSLPYWNYISKDRKNRKFPKSFGVQHLDGDMDNNKAENINPLYHPKRDFYFTSYEHGIVKPFSPLLELSDAAVDISLSMGSKVFFGATEKEGLGGGIVDDDPTTRGLLESYPHDHIHRAVGGVIPNGCDCACKPEPGEEPDFDAVGAMAQPPTAGFDPIFYVHHTTIDWIWTQWSCMPKKKWGNLPPNAWFNEKPWFFFDADGGEANLPRKSYFDHRKLGIRFKYEDLGVTPLQLPNFGEDLLEKFTPIVKHIEKIVENDIEFKVIPTSSSIIPVYFDSLNKVRDISNEMKAGLTDNFMRKRVLLKLPYVNLSNTEASGFDFYLASSLNQRLTRAAASFLGSLTLFNHTHHVAGGDMHMHSENQSNKIIITQTFDISKALASIEDLNQLHLVVKPYSLLTPVGTNNSILNRFPLEVKGLEIFAIQ